MIRELYTRNWDYTVYQVNDQKVISIVFWGMVDYHRGFFLLPDEIPQDFELLKTLSEHIRNNYEFFKDMEIIPAITAECLS